MLVVQTTSAQKISNKGIERLKNLFYKLLENKNLKKILTNDRIMQEKALY